MKRTLDVLLVEDDVALREVLALHLANEGSAVRQAGDGEEGLRCCAEKRPDVVVLDWMMPKLTGMEVCSALRAEHPSVPGIVMVTARDAEVDILLGFDTGADDYVIKLARPKEIVARVRAVGRRVWGELGPDTGPIVSGPVRINIASRRVDVSGVEMKLTPTEFTLLAFLARNQGRVYSRVDLLDKVFDADHPGYARNVDCRITRLRRKFEKAGLTEPPIETVHGAGYKFCTS